MTARDLAKPESDASVQERLLEAARAAAEHAYAPYSGFRVGAAVLTEDGRVVTGCNVENASYSLTMCAERTAVFSAVSSADRPLLIEALAVVNGGERPCAPCGACRQVLLEFGPGAQVFFFDGTSVVAKPVQDLLPYGFALPGS